MAVIGEIRSYNRRHYDDSEGFDGKVAGGRIRAALFLSGVGRFGAPGYPTQARYGAATQLVQRGLYEREQASYDSRFTSAELRLMEIWPGYQGYRWVYAEQYLSLRSIRPFRQRIYRFSPAPDGRILMAELTMPVPPILPVPGMMTPALLDSLTPQQLSLRHGCEIWLTRTPSGEL
ncbi:CpcT/CpeT family chromophore lyase [Aeromonas hydrophila]|uniref:CpcT/CpeT family chromophore lyase n=1 Tax=Aeromonas hydrophila TaxID=644 RepID=UPI003F7A4279